MTDIETIKATVRSRLTTRLAPPANPIGAPFDHGDYIIEELAGELIGFTRVNAFYDPSIGLPQDPSELDRYIATATANGWTKNNIYTYLDGTWRETNFEPGLTFAYVIAEDNYYGAYPAGWQELSIGGIDDYVTLTTDQNITGQKTFDQAIGVGTTNPQNLLHINGTSSPGLQISNGFSDSDDGLSINLESDAAVYSVDYNRVHRFRLEASPGVWKTGLTIEDTPSHGPICNMPMVNIGDPTGGSMGAGSINAESIYVNGEPVITGTFDLSDYYTKANLQTSGKSQVHANNITNAPWINKTISYWNTLNSDVFNIRSDDGPGIPGASTVYGGINVNIDDGYNFQIVGRNDRFFLRSEEDSTWLSWREIWHKGNLDPSDYYTKTQLQTSGGSSVHAGNITNVPWLTSLPSHDHDTRYYTYTQLQTSGQSQVHANNITNVPWLTSLPSHNHDTRYYTRTNLKTSGQSSVHWGNVTNKPSEFPVEYHVHDTDDLFTGVLPVKRGGTGFSNRYGYVVAHGINNPMDTIELIPWNHIDGKPTVFPPASHNHDTRYPLKGLGDIRASGGFATSLETGRDLFDNGIYAYTWRTDAENRPADATYGCAIKWSGGGANRGAAQLLVGWTTTAKNYIAFRSLRDTSDDWYPLKRIYHEGYKPTWDDIGSKPSVFPPASHNHSASDITSGTLSNSRLSFNPDYFVQGTDSYRRVDYNSTNTLDDNNASGFFRLDLTDPANPDGTNTYYGFRTRHNSNYSVELVGRADKNKLWFGGLGSGIRQPWREVWHSGNLDTANIAKLDADNVFTGVNTFDDSVEIKNGIKISDNSNHFFMIGPDLHGEAGNDLPSIKFYLKDYWSEYPNTSEQSIKVEADWIRNYADYRISNSAKKIGNSGLSTFSDDHIGGGVSNPVHIINNYNIDGTGAQITFGFGFSQAINTDYHHAGIKAVRTNKGADHASSIYLQARTPGTSSGPSGLTDIVEAGINDHQAFVKYHNNPPIIHSEYEIIGSNDQTLTPTKGVYICGGRVNAQEITLGTTGVENGQMVKILKASNLLAGVRYGTPGYYQWRSIGHYGAAEFIYYEGAWFCHGAEWEN